MSVNFKMGFPVTLHSQTIARRMSFSSHSHDVTSHGRLIRVKASAADKSSTIFARRWVCRNEEGIKSVMSPSIVRFTMLALFSPQATQTIRRADIKLDIPNVTALRGTFSLELNCDDAMWRASLPSSIRRQEELSCEPGSLNARFPTAPISHKAKSIPPQASISSS